MATNSNESPKTESKSDVSEKDEVKHPSSLSRFKTGDYTAFTSAYGVFLSFGGNIRNASCKSRHESIHEANQSAKQLFLNYKQSSGESMDCDEIMSDDPFQAFATICDGSNTIWIDVKELEIEKCNAQELKRIAKRENIATNQSKKKLLQILLPLIQHKKHENRYEDFDFRTCSKCRADHPQQYKKYQEEQDKDPNVIKSRLIKNMYRKQMLNPIKERDVTEMYGFTDDDLEEAVLAQEVHFQRRSCFGNTYRRYEKSDIVAYHKKMKRKKAEKRKLEANDDNEEVEEPATKKRKVDKEEEKVCDYKGVPEHLRKFKWLYLDCDALTDDGRKRIIEYLCAKYKRDDVESEDILMKRVISVEGGYSVTKESVFRMCFRDKTWKKICVKKKDIINTIIR